MRVITRIVALMGAALALAVFAPQPAPAFNIPWDSGHNTSDRDGDGVPDPPPDHDRTYDGDPVDLEAGNFVYRYIDTRVMGEGLRLRLTRSYHSTNRYTGPFGFGWHQLYDVRLLETAVDSGQLYYRKNRLGLAQRGEGDQPGTTGAVVVGTDITRIIYQTPAVIIRGGLGPRLVFLIDAVYSTTVPGSSNWPADPYGRPHISPPGWYLRLVKTGDQYVLTQKDGTRHFFEQVSPHNWRIARTVDTNGNDLNMTYDGQGRLARVTDDGGRYIEFTYNSDNRVIGVRDPAGRMLTYGYDASDNLTRFTDAEGGTLRYEYDTDHNLITVIDQNGNVRLSNTYDDNRRVVEQLTQDGTYTFEYRPDTNWSQVRRPDNTVWTYTWNDYGNPLNIRDPRNRNTAMTWDGQNNMVSRTDYRGATTTFAYDEMGNRTSMVDHFGRTTRYEYDPNVNGLTRVIWPDGSVKHWIRDSKGNVEQLIDETGEAWVFTYTADGFIATMTDPEGGVTRFTYDGNDHLETMTDAENETWTFDYNVMGRVVSLTEPDSHSSTLGYDDNDRLVSVRNALGHTRTMSYDLAGNLLTFTNQPGHTTTYRYDQHDRLTSVTNALGYTRAFTYDNMGRRTSISDREANTRSFTYDQYGNTAGVTNAIDAEFDFEWDSVGNHTRMTDALDRRIDFTYDLVDRLTQVNYASGASVVGLGYDSRDRWTTKTLRNGSEIGFRYDDTGRLVKKVLPSGEEVDYEYDDVGRLTRIADDDCTLQYVYDDVGRVTQITQNGLTVGFQYDADWNRTRTTYPDGEFVTKDYNGINQLTAIRDSGGQAIAGYTYDTADRLMRQTLANGTQVDYTYNDAYQLTNLVNSVSASGAVISRHAYTLDRTGRRVAVTTADGTTSYDYDAVYQLTGVDFPDGHPFPDATYTYDKMWNRDTVTTSGSKTYTVNSLNQYTDIGGLGLSYDGNDNAAGDGTYQYTFDDQNQLIQVTGPGLIATYKYCPLGRRIEKNVNGTITRYIYSGYRVLAESDEFNNLQARYVYGRSEEDVIRMSRGGQDYYPHYDGLGSVVALTNASGVTVEQFDYDAWGVPAATSSVGYPYLFAGRRYDTESGLYYNRYRYYDPEWGRFLSIDPFGMYGGYNLYAYCWNDPVNLVDPHGLKIKITGTDEERERINEGLEELYRRSETARDLIESLHNDDDTITIEITTGGNTYSPGTDTVRYNPDRLNIGPESWATRPPEVGMGHELVHAHHDLNGGIDMSNIQDEEHRTVGIEGYENEQFTENNIRDDYGLELRPRY